MMIVGLTGSIGMGKSTTSRMFADLGIPVHDADAAVHDLYAGQAAPLVEEAFPGTTSDGVVDRNLLGERVVGDPEAMRKLEAIIHPLVRETEIAFLDRARADGHPFVILDIPLLYETGADSRVDRVIVVTAPEAVQRERVLSRPGMTEQRFEAILAKQTPDAEKRRRADFLIDTSFGIDCARAKVADLTSVLEAMAREREQVLEDGSASL